MRFLLGPELIWIVIYGAANLIAKANKPPTHAAENFIQICWFWIPFLAFLCFVLWWIPAVEKNWLLLRVWVACFIGCHYSLVKLMDASSFQGPGNGMGWMGGIIFLFIFLVVGTVVVAVIPALKKML